MTKGNEAIILNREALTFVIESARSQEMHEANLGLFDGIVPHQQVNHALAKGQKTILLGEQTRLPYFPDDDRLPKLHSGDPLVLFLWKVLRKIPENLRQAIIEAPLSLTLLRSSDLLYFDTYRRHQAIHIGRRRRTIYLPEGLFHSAEERGYDYWALAEGIIFASWQLLDYLLLVDIVKAYQALLKGLPSHRLGGALQLKLIEQHGVHRRDSVDADRSELGEFADAYRGPLLALSPREVVGEDCFDLAHELFDVQREQGWAIGKMERIAQIFDFPCLFHFDRDIIHGLAHQMAEVRHQSVEPGTFSDVLHDYRDTLRFERKPLKTRLGKTVMPKPRAIFLQTVVLLGAAGLRNFFIAYGEGKEDDVRELMHPLWMYLCSLSSDPAGIFSRIGRCRAIGREELEEDWERPLAGILIRLDRAENYKQLVAEVGSMGMNAREELLALVRTQRLEEEDEWEVFKGQKQGIVTHACIALDALDGIGKEAEEIDWHSNDEICAALADRPHRFSSDPSGILMYMRTYKNTMERFGGGDPDSLFMLASILVRLDKYKEYDKLLECVYAMGKPAFSALHAVFEQIPERDMERRKILKRSRILWSRMMARTRRRTAKVGKS